MTLFRLGVEPRAYVRRIKQVFTLFRQTPFTESLACIYVIKPGPAAHVSPLPLAFSNLADTDISADKARPEGEVKLEKVNPFKLAYDFFQPQSEEELIVRLCRMPVNLSGPLLRSSLPTLTPQALLALIAVTGEAHHRLIAARPALDGRVIKALIRGQNDEVALTLARNAGLYLDEDDQLFLARRSVENPHLRAAVLENPGLPIARKWLQDCRAEGLSHDNLRLVALLRGRETAGFVQALARRLKCDIAALSRVLASESPVPLALSLCAAGLDRAIFLHILALWQACQGSDLPLAEARKPILLSIFDLSAEEARRKLAALIHQAH